MAETPSTMLSLGTALPALRLADAASGRIVDAKEELKGKKGLVVAFICNHCPFVVHIRAEMVRAAHRAIERGVAFIAVNSNDEVEYPQDGPAAMKKLAQGEGWRFPFVFDATQEVAKAFRAACTPDFFVFDAKGLLAYRGQFDDSRPSNGKPVTGKDLNAAVDAVAAGQAPAREQRASIGCNIKWKEGNEPSRS